MQRSRSAECEQGLRVLANHGGRAAPIEVRRVQIGRELRRTRIASHCPKDLLRVLRRENAVSEAKPDMRILRRVLQRALVDTDSLFELQPAPQQRAQME